MVVFLRRVRWFFTRPTAAALLGVLAGAAAARALTIFT